MKPCKNLLGQKFGKLTPIQLVSRNRQGSAIWKCLCDCGRTIHNSASHLCRKKLPVKSCGCGLRKRGKDNKNWTGVGDISGDWWFSHVAREIGQVKRKPIEVTITKEFMWELFLKQDRRCCYTGLPITISNTGKINTASIDRIDSELGYIPENVQWAHKHINFMKRTYSDEYFKEMCCLVADKAREC